MGAKVDGSGRLTHVMFADDTTLIAKSREALKVMLADVVEQLGDRGLHLNADKCKIQHSFQEEEYEADARLEAGGHSFPIVSAAVGFKILGTQLTLKGRTSREVSARISSGWAKFHQLWPLLNPNRGCLQKRFQLFESCVTRSVLWCCESWVPTQDEKRRLSSAQNDMLRRIMGIRREPWVIRATRLARSAAEQAGVKMWHEEHLATKWKWAGHVARMAPERLCKRAVEWRDTEWCGIADIIGGRPKRPKRNRWFRWEDDLHKHDPGWKDAAQNRDRWKQRQQVFVAATVR